MPKIRGLHLSHLPSGQECFGHGWAAGVSGIVTGDVREAVAQRSLGPPRPTVKSGAASIPSHCGRLSQVPALPKSSLCGSDRRLLTSCYCRSPRSPSPEASPETVPSRLPVSVKSTAELEASDNSAASVAVNARLPFAPSKRPVPPVIS